MSRQPRTIAQLRKRLRTECIEIFPFGKHKDELVADVVNEDPNYIVWWSKNIKEHPLHILAVWEGIRNYCSSPRNSYWGEDVGEWGDYEDMMDSPEGVLGDPWDPQGPF